MFISKEMIKDIGHESVEEFILDQARSHKIRINKFTDEGVDFDYELDSGGTDDGKLHLSKIEVATNKERIETLLIEFDELGMEPTLIVPNPIERANDWKHELTYSIRHLMAEVAREIFEEIEKYEYHDLSGKTIAYMLYAKDFAELKKKYTEGEK